MYRLNIVWLMILVLCFGPSLAKEQTWLAFSNNSAKKIKSIKIQNIDWSKDAFFLKLIVESSDDKVYRSDYWCMKKNTVYQCLGDDDGGKFLLKKNQKVLTLTVHYLNVGEPIEGRNISYLPDHPVDFLIDKGKN